MKYDGTITRVQVERDGITLIVQTVMGLRGVTLDVEEWAAIAADFGLAKPEDAVGWEVEYDPVHGDLEIVGPDRADTE